MRHAARHYQPIHPGRGPAVRQLPPFGSLPLSSSRGRRNNTVWAGPGEPSRGAPTRPIFRCHKSCIAYPVEHREYGRIADLALIRLVPRGHRRYLHMADMCKGSLESVAQIAAYNLGVVEIELNTHVGPPNFANNGGGMLGPGEKIIRPVAWIDRLNQERNGLFSRQVSRSLQVGNEDPLRRRALLGRHPSCQYMDLPAPNPGDVVERLAKQHAEVLFAPRQSRKAEFAGVQ